MGWGAILSAAVQAYSAYDAARENEKVAKERAKERSGTTTRTPYYNDAIQSIVPYLLGEQQKVYESRQGIAGIKPGDFSPFASVLGKIPQGYTGVSVPGGSPQVNQRYAGPGSAMSPEQPPQMAPSERYAPAGATISPDEGGGPMMADAMPQMGAQPQMPQMAQMAQRNPEMIRYWEDQMRAGAMA